MTSSFSTVETALLNSSFLILFVTTLGYWLEFLVFKSQKFKIAAFSGLVFFELLITFELVVRWFSSGHFPLSNLYESLLFLAWGLLSFYIFLELKTKLDFLGVFLSPLILSLIAFTTFTLPPELQESRPLVPALQSNWLFMHVSVMMLSYASLLVGCILSFGYLISNILFQNKILSSSILKFLSKELRKESVSVKKSSFNFTLDSINQSQMLQPKVLNENKIPAENFFVQTSSFNFFETLDSLSYRMLSIGFCFLTLGILSGAVWANETWGSYWSWDPKETWALITWLTFAIYLHTRLIQGWEGIKPAWIASFGFVIIWVCYLGVNLLGKGLHSYGFLTN